VSRWGKYMVVSILSIALWVVVIWGMVAAYDVAVLK
jgi:hypothetical protein